MIFTPTQICTRPAASLVASIRARHGYTQLQCAYIAGVKERTWQTFESIDQRMPLPTWWLWLLRIGEITPSQLPPIPPRQRFGAMVNLLPG